MRPAKETYKRDLQKRPIERDLQKRPAKRDLAEGIENGVAFAALLDAEVRYK